MNEKLGLRSMTSGTKVNQLIIDEEKAAITQRKD